MGNSDRGLAFDRPQIFAEGQTRAIIAAMGIEPVQETEEVFVVYCPFHNNFQTPSFAISKTDNGKCLCYNESCNYKGNMFTLIMDLTKRSYRETLRYLDKFDTDSSLLVEKALVEPTQFEFTEWDVETMTRLVQQMWSCQEGRDYLHHRGYTDETIRAFNVGYSSSQKMVAVPLYNIKELLVGIIGRSIKGKAFLNSKKLPRNHTMFNLQNAKRYGDICIVCEASFDAMKIHQAGFPNVVATLGGNISPTNLRLLDMYFQTIINMTDNDETNYEQNCKAKTCRFGCVGHNPGRDLGLHIESALSHKNILWATYDVNTIYPGAKDAGEMTEDQIQQCINNAMTSFEYHLRFDG